MCSRVRYSGRLGLLDGDWRLGMFCFYTEVRPLHLQVVNATTQGYY
jgi:hypothetical protein